MKKQITIFAVTILCLTFIGCEAMAELFHGPKPEPKPVTYAVTYNANGATSGTPPEKQTVNAGSVINLPDKGNLTKGTDIFDGWNINAAGTGTNYAASTSYTVNGDITLYAKWTEKDTSCKITFNINGGSGTTPTEQTKNAGLAITLPDGSGFSRTGYTSVFAGWNTNSSGTGANYNSGASYTVTGTITLYARWRPYELGETGPSGGKIFFRSGVGFTYYASRTDTIGTTRHYLEAASADMATELSWASSDHLATDITGTATAIGTGMKNTLSILAKDLLAPAAKECIDYSGNGKNDWFLPSKEELNQLYLCKTKVGNLKNSDYWSSSQENIIDAWRQSFTDGNQHGGIRKHNPKTIRAIRAF